MKENYLRLAFKSHELENQTSKSKRHLICKLSSLLLVKCISIVKFSAMNLQNDGLESTLTKKKNDCIPTAVS